MFPHRKKGDIINDADDNVNDNDVARRDIEVEDVSEDLSINLNKELNKSLNDKDDKIFIGIRIMIRMILELILVCMIEMEWSSTRIDKTPSLASTNPHPKLEMEIPPYLILKQQS